QRARQRYFDPIKNPGGAERRHDQPMPGTPWQSIQPRRHMRFNGFTVWHPPVFSRKQTSDAKRDRNQSGDELCLVATALIAVSGTDQAKNSSAPHGRSNTAYQKSNSSPAPPLRNVPSTMTAP